MLPLKVRTLHAENEGAEEDEKTDDSNIKSTVDRPLVDRTESLGRPVHSKSSGQNCEVQGWIVVVDVGDTCHGHERKVVEEPAYYWIKTRDPDVVNILHRKVIIATLPANKVPNDYQAEESQGSCTAPVNNGISKEEVLDDLVVPRTHAETNIEDGPLPELGRQIILLIWIRDEGIVGRHHCDIEMDEIFEERRLVGTRVATRDCNQKLAFLKYLPEPLLTFFVYMSLHIPVSIYIPRLVLFDASGLNLSETPLGKIYCTSTQIAA